MPPGFVISGEVGRNSTARKCGMCANCSGLSSRAIVLPHPADPPKIITSAADSSAARCGPGCADTTSAIDVLYAGVLLDDLPVDFDPRPHLAPGANDPAGPQ